ncbi:MAG: hypothetical protein JRI80_19905 [Deltaproteobacteria bacterium]|nr:hypothetical protein [Deltaproteobacteria bacterium]
MHNRRAMKRSAQYKKGYKKGFNNPGSFDQAKLLRSSSELARGVVAGICDRKIADADGTVHFIFD